jgi:hypothetical protein
MVQEPNLKPQYRELGLIPLHKQAKVLLVAPESIFIAVKELMMVWIASADYSGRVV